MPRPISEGNELHDVAVASHEQVSGYLEATYLREIRMRMPVQTVAE
jgi:hypothetical protein